MTEQTVKIEETICDLDGLYQSYGVILEQAKAQLEKLEITKESATVIAEELAKDREFKGAIVNSIATSLKESLQSNDPDEWLRRYASSAFLRELGKQVMNEIRTDIADFVRTSVQGAVDGYAFQRTIKEKVESYEGIDSALALQKAFADVLAKIETK